MKIKQIKYGLLQVIKWALTINQANLIAIKGSITKNNVIEFTCNIKYINHNSVSINSFFINQLCNIYIYKTKSGESMNYKNFNINLLKSELN